MFFFLSKAAWMFAEPSSFLFGLALVGLLLNWAGRARAGRVVLSCALGLMLAAAVLPLGDLMLASLEARFPEGGDEGTVDGIVALGGAVDADSYFGHRGSGLNAAVGRIVEVARLAREHPNAKLVFAGGPTPPPGQRHGEADAARDLFVALGVAPERLIFERDSRNTYENALFVQRIARPRPGERWLLVTSAFHMPRAMGCFRAVGFPVIAHPVDFRYLGQTSVGFDLPGGLGGLDLAAHEWSGLLAYWMTGKTSELFPAP